MPTVPVEELERIRSMSMQTVLDARKVARLEVQTAEQFRQGLDFVEIPNLTEQQTNLLKTQLSTSLKEQGDYDLRKTKRNGDLRYALQVSRRIH